MAEPQRLDGGNMGEVWRVDDAVRRPAGDWTPAIHRLLSCLAAAGVPGVPAPLSIEADGTELVGYVEGVVPAYPMPTWVWDEAALVSAARLLRAVHDATAGLDLPGPWRSPVREPAEVICHNDFAPYNLVFERGDVVGAIDWDYASPGPRLWDLAYLAYRIVPLSDHDRADAFLDGERRQRLDLLLATYGSSAEPDELLAVVRERLVELAAFSDRMAVELGRPELHEHAAGYRHDAETPFW
ncbi:MAG TPA: phosphotransferase [Jatrophihabitans sp.]|nr:phosphotransferase [Jatrophihabitans sp.]